MLKLLKAVGWALISPYIKLFSKENWTGFREAFTPKFFDDIKLTFQLYALTLPWPLTLSIMNIIVCGILGVVPPNPELSFWYNFKVIWIDYYFTGHLFGIIAYRWQLLFLLFCFIFTKTAER